MSWTPFIVIGVILLVVVVGIMLSGVEQNDVIRYVFGFLLL